MAAAALAGGSLADVEPSDEVQSSVAGAARKPSPSICGSCTPHHRFARQARQRFEPVAPGLVETVNSLQRLSILGGRRRNLLAFRQNVAARYPSPDAFYLGASVLDPLPPRFRSHRIGYPRFAAGIPPVLNPEHREALIFFRQRDDGEVEEIVRKEAAVLVRELSHALRAGDQAEPGEFLESLSGRAEEKNGGRQFPLGLLGRRMQLELPKQSPIAADGARIHIRRLVVAEVAREALIGSQRVMPGVLRRTQLVLITGQQHHGKALAIHSPGCGWRVDPTLQLQGRRAIGRNDVMEVGNAIDVGQSRRRRSGIPIQLPHAESLHRTLLSPDARLADMKRATNPRVKGSRGFGLPDPETRKPGQVPLEAHAERPSP